LPSGSETALSEPEALLSRRLGRRPKGGETFPPFALRVRDPAYRQAGALGRRPKGDEGGLNNFFQRTKVLPIEGFTPLESPAKYGWDGKINNIHLRPAYRRQEG